MNVVDVVIIILLVLGGIAGFKAGVIKKLTDFIGMFSVVVLAFYLKNYISVILYENLPFFNFFGLINGINALNILLYEVIAFLIIFTLLLFVLKVILLATGLIEKILKATIILSIPSKILGIVVGIIEMYVYIFLVLVIATLPVFDSSFLKESKMSNYILNNTLVLSDVSDEITSIYGDVYTIIDNRKDKSNEEMNEEILKVLIDKKVVTKESARKLVDKNKVHINDVSIVEQEVFMSLIHYENDFDKLIEKEAVVDFYATWCGPCKMFGPIFEEVGEGSDINFIKVDVDKYSDIARSYGVMTIPTTILFRDGKEVKRNIGFMSEEEFIDFLKQLLLLSHILNKN